jgi:hypothetical protein
VFFGVGVDDDSYELAALILVRRFLPLDLALNELLPPLLFGVGPSSSSVTLKHVL